MLDRTLERGRRAGLGRTTLGLPLALACALAGAAAAVPSGVEAQTWRTVTMSRQLSDETSMDVEVHFGAGRFNVGPSEEGLLYRMEMRYDENLFEPDVEYDPGQLKVDIERTGSAFRLGRDHSGGSLDLGLSRDVILDLDLEFGAVRADIELGGLTMSELALATGASETMLRVSEPNPETMRRASIEAGAAEFDAELLGNLNAERIEIGAGLGDVSLDFGGEWQRDAVVEVDMGMGALDLRFPRGLGVRLEMDSFLASLDSQGLIKDGEVYFSPDWEEAERRVTIQVDAALGSVDVSWTP